MIVHILLLLSSSCYINNAGVCTLAQYTLEVNRIFINIYFDGKIFANFYCLN